MSVRRTGTIAAFAATALALAVLSGCAPAAQSERPQVHVTTNILGDVVAELAGDEIDVTTLMAPGADPHSFELSARQAAEMRSADLIVANGLGLEEGLSQHVAAAAEEGVAIFEAGAAVEVLAYAEGAGDDPHFWTDPAQMIRVVDALTPLLAELAADARGAERVREAATDYRADLAALDGDMTAAFAAIPPSQRALVTNHHVFGYLARRFDFDVLGAAIPSGTTLAAPSAADLQGLVTAIDAAGVRTIFAESSQPDRLMQVLAEEAHREVAVVELLTESLAPRGEEGDTYLTMMRTNTARLAAGLSR